MYGSATSGAGGSTTETTLTWLSAGQGRRATSSTARSLQGEPSVARRIFMAVSPFADAARAEHARRTTFDTRRVHGACQRGLPSFRDSFAVCVVRDGWFFAACGLFPKTCAEARSHIEGAPPWGLGRAENFGE